MKFYSFRCIYTHCIKAEEALTKAASLGITISVDLNYLSKYGTIHNRSEHHKSCIHQTNEVVDRKGSGDAFMGGLIYALKAKMDLKEVIEEATRVGFEKLFINGDF